VYSRDELRDVAEWARDRGVWLISDEIYREINFSDDGSPAASVFDLPQDSVGPHVVVDGASKCYAMTGWRIGYSYCEPTLAKKLSALQSHINSNPATPSQLAALRAYGDPDRAQESAAEMTQAFLRRRDLAVRLTRDLLPELPFVPPEGAFYLFIRVDGAFGRDITDSSGFCTWLLEETGVALVPGVAFGDDRYVRLSFATSDEVLEEGIRRRATAVSSR
jgi:aspartate aminotransferase